MPSQYRHFLAILEYMTLPFHFEIKEALSKHGSVTIGLNGIFAPRFESIDPEDYTLAGVENSGQYEVYENLRGTFQVNTLANDFLAEHSDKTPAYKNTVVIKDLKK